MHISCALFVKHTLNPKKTLYFVQISHTASKYFYILGLLTSFLSGLYLLENQSKSSHPFTECICSGEV